MTTLHHIQTRSNQLTAPINVAVSRALDPTDAYSVWSELVRMAEHKPAPAPLIGFMQEGIQYEGREYYRSGVPDVLTFKNFADRFRRRANA